jgi:hypothetical protein
MDFADDVGMDFPRKLRDLYRFPGFEPRDLIAADDKVSEGVIITLNRLPQKDSAVPVVSSLASFMILAGGVFAISLVAIALSLYTSLCFGSSAIGAAA